VPGNGQRGTNTLGAANSGGGGSAGGGRPTGKRTTTDEGGSDATINNENKKLDRTVKSICKGC